MVDSQLKRVSEVSLAKDFLTLQAGDSFKSKGRTYKVIADGAGKLYAEEQDKATGFKGICRSFWDRIGNLSLSSRESQLSAKLLKPADRHFLLDVDKTLLYRGNLPKSKNPDDFIQAKIDHEKYGPGTTVHISKSVVNYLRQQVAVGAKVSIASTGGWNIASVKKVLAELPEDYKLEINGGGNKTDMNNRTRLHSGINQKYRALGPTDRDGRQHIMMDDQKHQLAFFKHKINAKELGMGPAK